MRGLASMWRRLRAARRGATALEFAIVTPLMVTIILGTFDIGNILQQRIKLTDAVRTGGQYASSYPTDSTGIVTTVRGALPAGWTNVTVSTPTTRCTCWTSGVEAEASCSDSPVCPGSNSTPARYLTLTAARPNAPLLLLTLTSTSASYVARVQ